LFISFLTLSTDSEPAYPVPVVRLAHQTYNAAKTAPRSTASTSQTKKRSAHTAFRHTPSSCNTTKRVKANRTTARHPTSSKQTKKPYSTDQDSAVVRALETVEILEDILLWHFALEHAKALAIPSTSDSQRARALPHRRLLQLHLVSRHWRAVIKDSTSLSRLLFTKPLASGPTDHSHYDDDDDNTTLRKRRRHHIGLRGAEADADADAGSGNSSAGFEVNLLLLNHSDDRFFEHEIVRSSQADGRTCTFPLLLGRALPPRRCGGRKGDVGAEDVPDAAAGRAGARRSELGFFVLSRREEGQGCHDGGCGGYG